MPPGGVHVVEGHDAAPDFLALLVSLAGDQDQVPSRSFPNGEGDGSGPIHLDEDIPRRRGTCGDLLDDGFGLLGARIIGGDHGQVG